MRRRWIRLLLAVALLALLAAAYIRTHPPVFMKTHAHCIKVAGVAFQSYADQHGGRFPFHAKGYGNALLLLDEDIFSSLTGPGYDARPLREAKAAGRDLPEEEC